MSKKSRLGDNPLDTMTGAHLGAGKRAEYDATFPAVACRLPRATADELRAIAEANGFTLAELVAAALVDFCERNRRGEVAVTATNVPATRRVAKVTH